ncbi:hypothetical protein EJ110_NYTH07726 [Nymphaea thermarum]|nr:hypothetical protein EJ110_NYTH07726 [Nymphaea thermarum]
MEIVPEEESVIYHFSHVHALQLNPALKPVSSQNGRSKTHCCGSVLDAAEPDPIYGCSRCNFFIHKACAELLPYIRHPSHPSHTLTLVPTSPYLDYGTAACDACAKTINGGFFYHCTHCDYDLHAHCAFLPRSLGHGSHRHRFFLDFSSAYGTSAFDCDICGERIVRKTWFYHCSKAACDYEAHVDCAVARPDGAVIPGEDRAADRGAEIPDFVHHRHHGEQSEGEDEDELQNHLAVARTLLLMRMLEGSSLQQQKM